MEITKREIIVSIIIISVMLILGLFISEKILDSQLEKNDMYNKSVKIDNQELFQYGMDTNIGNAFVYGDLEAIDTVTYPEISGSYLYIEKVKERYTMHTRTVSTGSGKTRTTRVETYWTWDRVGSESIHSKNVKFLNIKFDYCKINTPDTNYIDTIKESSHVRYKYYGCNVKYTGTIYTKLMDNTISDNSSFYNEMNIEKTIDYLESGVGLIIFKVLWFLLTVGLVVGFYYLDNEWIEN